MRPLGGGKTGQGKPDLTKGEKPGTKDSQETQDTQNGNDGTDGTGEKKDDSGQ